MGGRLGKLRGLLQPERFYDSMTLCQLTNTKTSGVTFTKLLLSRETRFNIETSGCQLCHFVKEKEWDGEAKEQTCSSQIRAGKAVLGDVS